MRKHLFFLLLTALCIGFYSCSDNGNDDYDPLKDLVEIDYVADLGYFKDMTINTDGAVYALAYDQSATTSAYPVKKVLADGSISLLNISWGDHFGNTLRITNTNDGKLYWTSDMSPDRDKILTFSDNFSGIGTIKIKGTDGPFSPAPRLTAIAPYENNSLVVFDVSYRQLKRYYFSLNTDIVMAGSEKDEVKDGVGLKAGFSYVNRILPYGNILYVLDKSKNIRMVEMQESLPKVTTVLADSPVEIRDMAIDADGNFYLATTQGLYTLKKGSKNIKLITEKGSVDIKTKDGKPNTLHFSVIDNLYIKGNDLYFVTGHGTLNKISDFKNKLQELKDKGSL